MYIAVKTHQTLKWVHFIVCKLYLNKLTKAISLRSLGTLSASRIILNIWECIERNNLKYYKTGERRDWGRSNVISWRLQREVVAYVNYWNSTSPKYCCYYPHFTMKEANSEIKWLTGFTRLILTVITEKDCLHFSVDVPDFIAVCGTLRYEVQVTSKGFGSRGDLLEPCPSSF